MGTPNIEKFLQDQQSKSKDIILERRSDKRTLQEQQAAQRESARGLATKTREVFAQNAELSGKLLSEDLDLSDEEIEQLTKKLREEELLTKQNYENVRKAHETRF